MLPVPFIVLKKYEAKRIFWLYMQKICSYGVYFIFAILDQDSIFHCQIELAVVLSWMTLKLFLPLVIRHLKM